MKQTIPHDTPRMIAAATDIVAPVFTSGGGEIRTHDLKLMRLAGTTELPYSAMRA